MTKKSNDTLKRPFLSHLTFTNISNQKNIITNGYDYALAGFSLDLFQTYRLPIPVNIQRAVRSRQAEYLAGRITALGTLNTLGFRVQDIPIGPHRSPLWPNDVRGSLTHTKTQTLCAVSRASDYHCIGIDMENWLPQAVVKEIKYRVINLREETVLQSSGMDFCRAFTLALSAKESFFKAAYPSLGYYFDFNSVDLVAISPEQNIFTLRLLKSLGGTWTLGREVNGYFLQQEDAVQTLIAEAAAPTYSHQT